MAGSSSKLLVGILLALGLMASVLSTSASAGVQWIEEVDYFDGTQGTGPSLQIADDGSPVVAFFNPELSSIMLLRCNVDCNSGTINEVASISQGQTAWPSLRLNPSGNPVVAFLNNGRINVVRCDDPVCDNGGDTSFLVGRANPVGFPALALDESGFPSVAYINADLGVDYVSCVTRNCSTSREAKNFRGNIEQTATVPDLEFDPENRPVIAYTRYAGDAPRNVLLLRCHEPACETGWDTIAGFESIGNPQLAFPTLAGDDTWSIVIGGTSVDGSLYGETCLNTDCTRLNGTTSIDLPDRAAYVGDMAWSDSVGAVYAYNDFDVSGHIQVASRAIAEPNRVYSVGELERFTAPDVETTGYFWPDIELRNDQAVIAYISFDGLRVVECDDAGCVPTCNGLPATVDMGVGGQLASGRPDAVVYGTPDRDLIEGFGQVICGGGGDDYIVPGVAESRVFAGAGNDTVYLREGKGFVSGGPGNDRLTGSRGLDRLFGGPGADILTGGAGTDRLSGGDGNDTLDGGHGDDKLYGNLGRDTLQGGPGNDFIKGGAWIDTVDGGDGDDDRCGIVEGEIRVNCERGVFGF